jgi:hypothetical protein
MIQKLLYAFVAQETLALLEKINATDSTYDSSYQAADHLHRRGKFNFVERKLLAKALKKVARRETLVGAMNVVVYNNVEGEVHNKEQQTMLYSPTLGMRGDGGILQSAAQNAWERQLGQNAVQSALGHQYSAAQQHNLYGVIR